MKQKFIMSWFADFGFWCLTGFGFYGILWESINRRFPMVASIDQQVSAMSNLTQLITYEWDKAKSTFKSLGQMQDVWRQLTESKNYAILVHKRKETIRFLWDYVRNQTLTQNTIFGYWVNGSFYSNWCDLPDSYKHNDTLFNTLPSGHFWVNGCKATTIRYFVSSDRVNEDSNHFG